MFTSCRHNIHIALTSYCSNRRLATDVLLVEVPEVSPSLSLCLQLVKVRASHKHNGILPSELLNTICLAAGPRQGEQCRVDTAGLHPGTVCCVCSLGSFRLPGSNSFPGPLSSLLLSLWLACVCLCVCVNLCICVRQRVLGKHPAAGWVALQTSSSSCLETAALEWCGFYAFLSLL